MQSIVSLLTNPEINNEQFQVFVSEDSARRQ